MCGIAGVLRIHAPGEPVPPHLEAIPDAWLDILDDSIKHRGPDGCGRFRDRATRPDGTVVDVALVHRRLSIIDHAGGAQPMVHVRGQGLLTPPHTGGTGVSPDSPPSPHPGGTGFQPVTPSSLLSPSTLDATTLPEGTDLVAVAFNGCIYNHRELRAELEACGHRFETDHSDTEVFIHGWREWGLRMQDELDGMYASLIWDRRTGQLAWGRDLAGEKPLYMQHFDLAGITVIGSTQHSTHRAVSRWDERAAQLGTLGAAEWLRFGAFHMTPLSTDAGHRASWTIHPSLPFRGDDSGPKSRSIRANHPSIANRAFGGKKLSLPQRARASNVRDPEAQFHDLVRWSVISRLEADVPLGLFLSGGIDSGLIAAIAHKERPDIEAFTVRTPQSERGPRYDESEAAAETARAIGVTHHILDCHPQSQTGPADDLVHLIEQLGLPFGDSSLLPTYWVAKAAREHVKVALSGDGGDELFGGYRRHTINTTLNRWRHLLRLIPDALLDQRRPGSRSTYLARFAVAARHGGYSELLSIFPTPDLRQLLTIEGDDPPGDDEFHEIDDPLRHDFLHYLPDDLLRKTDTASMAVGLEVRAPFLARDLVDAAMRTPLDVLMPRGERKGLLKQIARRYLPDKIVDRPKQGFAIPIGEWFRSDYGGLRQLLRDHLESADPFPGLARAGVEINMSFVHRMLREHDRAGEASRNPWRGRDHSQRLYMLLVLSIWCRWLRDIGRAVPADAP